MRIFLPRLSSTSPEFDVLRETGLQRLSTLSIYYIHCLSLTHFVCAAFAYVMFKLRARVQTAGFIFHFTTYITAHRQTVHSKRAFRGQCMLE